MLTYSNKLTKIKSQYPLETIAPLSDIVFFDIETTGFSAASSTLYLIGCAYYESNAFRTIQWFAEEADDEERILIHFFEFIARFQYILHYNGAHFDIPYIMKKVQNYGLDCSFDALESIDIYKMIVPYKQFLALENLKQKSIETFLQVQRTDHYDGGQLISVYHDYLKSKTEFNRELLLLHNADDLAGMLMILPVLAYYDLFHKPFTIQDAVLNEYTDFDGHTQNELLISCTTDVSIPRPITCKKDGCTLICQRSSLRFRIPIYERELKYFYPNPKDYYYLPDEDVAIHKSVATYVAPSHRVNATLSTCYTKKKNRYLPQWDAVFEPAFMDNYRDKQQFFAFDESILTDIKTLSKYCSHMLEKLFI